MYLFKSIRAVLGLSPGINNYRFSSSKVLVRGIDKHAEYAVDLGSCLEGIHSGSWGVQGKINRKAFRLEKLLVLH